MGIPEKTADLHTHTTYSDGADAPPQLIELAKEVGLSALSITDHDILEAYEVALPVAERLGIELIPGLELSSSLNGKEVHMLGFFLELNHAGLQQLLAEQRTRRIKRVETMVRRLKEQGVVIELEDVFRFAGAGSVGRPHVAQALLARGYVTSLEEAFDRYIGPRSRAFVPGSPISPAEAIRAIRQAAGIPVLAHPAYLKDDSLIEGMRREGLAGLEVYHSSHTREMIRHYEQLADRFGLLRTGGSDYHGAAKEGCPIGSVKVPYRFVDELKRWRQTTFPSENLSYGEQPH